MNQDDRSREMTAQMHNMRMGGKLRVVKPVMDADQLQDAIDDRNTDMARLQADVKTCMARHGKKLTLDAVIDAYRAADLEGAKW